MKKIIKRIIVLTLAVLLIVIVAGGITVYSVWFNEINTAFSFKKIRNRDDSHQDGAVYEMDVKGSYYFEDFLKEGATSDSELIAFITEKITKGLIPMNITETDISCSAFTAKLPNGDRIFGRNYDMEQTSTCIVKTNPSHGYASVSTVDLRYLGLDTKKDVTGLVNRITALAAPYVPLDGINEKGVACAIFMSYQGEDDKSYSTNQTTDLPDITSTTMLRMILDYADSVEKAVELVQKYDLHDSANSSFHYMVADSTGKSAILEWVYGTDATDNDGTKRKLTVTYQDSDSEVGELEAAATDYQWVTNFIVAPGYYQSDDEKAGLNRYQIIGETLSKTNGLMQEEKDAFELLKNVGQRHLNSGLTIHSIVFNLTQRSYHMVTNEHFDDETAYFKYTV